MDSVSLSGPECSTCGASLTRGVCAACALGDLLPKGETQNSGATLDADFGRYLLKQKLAAGGMGIVYRAQDQQLKRTVALKMIKGSTFASDGDMARFTIETEAAAALDHPDITPVYEVGVIDDQPFFTMKLISGESLASKLRADTIPDLRLCVQWLASIAKAV